MLVVIASTALQDVHLTVNALYGLVFELIHTPGSSEGLRVTPSNLEFPRA